jgi:hypothetical protein
MLIAFDVLRQEKALTPEEDKTIYDWFEKIVAKTSIGPNDGAKDKMPPGNHTEALKLEYILCGVF